MDKNFEMFVLHITTLETKSLMSIYPVREAKIVVLNANHCLTNILGEYLEYTDVISSHLTIDLLKYTSIIRRFHAEQIPAPAL